MTCTQTGTETTDFTHPIAHSGLGVQGFDFAMAWQWQGLPLGPLVTTSHQSRAGQGIKPNREVERDHIFALLALLYFMYNYYGVADPEFSWGAPTLKVGVLTYYFVIFLMKTAWKLKNLDPGTPWIRQCFFVWHGRNCQFS